MKAIKRELKEWEHSFISTHGRKPEKKDIAADRIIAKKYKNYAKLKQESDRVAATADNFPSDHKHAVDTTIRNSLATTEGVPEPFKVPFPNRKSKSPSRAAEDNSGNCGILEDGDEHTFISRFGTPPKKADLLPLSSQVTIMDEEDRAAQEFFNENYRLYDDAQNLSITKDDLKMSIRPSNLRSDSSNSAEPTNKNCNAQSNFKFRKSTVATGPIPTDGSLKNPEANNNWDETDLNFCTEEPKISQPFTFRTYSPSRPTAIVNQEIQQIKISEPESLLNSSNLEIQDFMTRRQQIAERTSSPVAVLKSSYDQNAEFLVTNLIRPTTTTVKEANAPIVTKIRVLTPVSVSTDLKTKAENSPTKQQKLSKPILDLPRPNPPTIIKFNDISTQEDSDYNEDATSEISQEDEVAVVMSGKIDQIQHQAKKQQKKLTATNPLVEIKKKPENGFFIGGKDINEVIEDEVIPFDTESLKQKLTAKYMLSEKVTTTPERKPESEIFEVETVKEPTADEIIVDSRLEMSPSAPSPTINQLFITQPKMFSRILPEYTLKCRLQRKTNILDKAHPTFYLYNEIDDKFLLAARKRKKSTTVNYLISTSMDDLSKDSTHYVAKLKANFQRTNFVLLDARFYNKNTRDKGLKELACVSYSKTVLPREINVAIAATKIEEGSTEFTKDIMADIKINLLAGTKQHNRIVSILVVVLPNRRLKIFNLLLKEVFGRCGPDIFTLDARYPMTPMEAFAVAITTFDAYDSA
ncbi:hypothetical protein HK100_011202 [Physocladia obscura]|uniref:DNA replication regulator SLD2 n=1 Tax=Physocladia obscura TaxID=109957 RepID=A0AAD5XDE4_9FUNG|nr:hypothetical protein HK100_011202 [Physocladia obscura]